MKKLIIVCKILVLFIILAKIAATADHFLSVNKAAADSSVATDVVPPVKDVLDDSLSEERKLLSLLLEKQKALDAQEIFLKTEEKRLNSLRDEILSKIDGLREIEGRLTELLETVKGVNEEKYRGLAKVYEAVPPARAGSMLEKLDTKTAAAILMNMKSKKAGVILGHVDPAKSVKITKEITR